MFSIYFQDSAIEEDGREGNTAAIFFVDIHLGTIKDRTTAITVVFGLDIVAKIL